MGKSLPQILYNLIIVKQQRQKARLVWEWKHPPLPHADRKTAQVFQLSCPQYDTQWNACFEGLIWALLRFRSLQSYHRLATTCHYSITLTWVSYSINGTKPKPSGLKITIGPSPKVLTLSVWSYLVVFPGWVNTVRSGVSGLLFPGLLLRKYSPYLFSLCSDLQTVSSD